MCWLKQLILVNKTNKLNRFIPTVINQVNKYGIEKVIKEEDDKIIYTIQSKLNMNKLKKPKYKIASQSSIIDAIQRYCKDTSSALYLYSIDKLFTLDFYSEYINELNYIIEEHNNKESLNAMNRVKRYMENELYNLCHSSNEDIIASVSPNSNMRKDLIQWILNYNNQYRKVIGEDIEERDFKFIKLLGKGDISKYEYGDYILYHNSELKTLTISEDDVDNNFRINIIYKAYIPYKHIFDIIMDSFNFKIINNK